MLLQELEPTHDVCGWLVSEKLDGWRCILDSGRVYSRHGRVFTPPDEWLESMPQGVVLDGELWAGRGTTCRDVLSATQRGDWKRLTFHAFDAPLHFGDFQRRLDYVRAAIHGSAALHVPHWTISGYDEARAVAAGIYRNGGEGIVLRNPAGMYRQGSRSPDVLKFKPGA